MISFEAVVPVPIRNPKFFDTRVVVLIETECFNHTYGSISLYSGRGLYRPLRSFDFCEIVNQYDTDHSPKFGVMNQAVADQLESMKIAAELIRINWDDLIHRLTRNIPKKRIAG